MGEGQGWMSDKRNKKSTLPPDESRNLNEPEKCDMTRRRSRGLMGMNDFLCQGDQSQFCSLGR